METLLTITITFGYIFLLAGLLLAYLNKTNSAINSLILCIICIIISMVLLAVLKTPNEKDIIKETIECSNNQIIILPEEYNQIKATDTLRGYYDSTGVLHIEFNNKRNNQ